ncbi:MAG: hypothetical protein J6P48_04910 [Oscillospiraceae bacterium]|nr:hypothetical protein [Oscillospiraceae bacterium]
MPFEAWQLGLIDQAGYNGIRDEHLAAVAAEILKIPGDSVNDAEFRSACYRAGVDPDNFRQSDLDRLQQVLDQY